MLLAASLISGCVESVPKKQMEAHFESATSTPAESPQKNQPSKTAAEKVIVTPSTYLKGTVVSVNAGSRFAVLNFPAGTMPSKQSLVHVYRGGVKVGEMKVSGEPLDDNIVADILEGEALAGDEIRTD